MALEKDLQLLTTLDRVLHEPARLMLVAYLSAVEKADFLFLLRETGLTRGNLSSHLSKLEEIGYVEIQKGFLGKRPHTLCLVTSKGVTAFQNYRQTIKQALDL